MIHISRANEKEVKKFRRREWKRADIEHYGHSIKWVEKDFILKAKDQNEIVGVVKFKYEGGGIIYIKNLIIAEDRRGRGIGRKIMEQIEKMGKQLKAHKIYLFTGQNWKARGFYEKLGYKKTADLPKHYFKQNFVVYSKLI